MSGYEEIHRDQIFPERFNDDEFRPWGMETKQFCMLMHLAQFAGYIIPFAGLILPIVMWASNKDQSDEVDRHGKAILNWIISLFVYSIVTFILVFFFIGIILIFALFALSILFPILGAVKAGNGEYYDYPLAINFIS